MALAPPAAAVPSGPDALEELIARQTQRPTARPPSPAAEAGQDQALLGKQVELAQRMVDEKPEEAIVALRRMLKPAAGA